MKKLFTTLIILVSCSFGFAQSFTAQVDRSNLGLGDAVHLKLALENATDTTPPDFSVLNSSFQVVGQQESSMTQIINGHSSSSKTWNITLIPFQTGALSIPPITVETKNGALQSSTVPIQVSANPASGSTPQGRERTQRNIALTGKANKKEIYKNEPVLVTFTLTSPKSLANVQQPPQLNIQDAIVESQGGLKEHTEVINAHKRQVVQVSYLVTPVKEGSLKIPSLVIRGQVLEPEAPTASPVGNFNSLFDEDEDPFAGMQKIMKNFMRNELSVSAETRSFAVASPPMELRVLPPVVGVEPWLPANDLKLSESWSADTPKAGEPITRLISLEAKGLSASQLPGMENQFKSNEDYKVYTDRPETSMQLIRGEVVSSRKDTYTIVPQKSGSLKLPALRLVWWDTQTRTKKIATLPERTFQVTSGISALPPMAANDASPAQISTPPARSGSEVAAPGLKPFKPYILYALVVYLLGMFAFLVYQISKLNPTVPTSQKKPIPEIKTGRKDLEKCRDFNEVNLFLQSYSREHWGAPANANLALIFSVAGNSLQNFDFAMASSVSNRLGGAIYAGQMTNLEDLKRDLGELLFKKKVAPQNQRNESFLAHLNPS